MNYLNSYLGSKLDLSHIGFRRGEKETNYFCTPVLSKVIGWAGVDGIHFCISKHFGDIIFAVSPMNTPGNYAHPVARNFEDFLRLIFTCLIFILLFTYRLKGNTVFAIKAKNILYVASAMSLGPLVFGLNYFSVVGGLITASLIAELLLLQFKIRSNVE